MREAFEFAWNITYLFCKKRPQFISMDHMYFYKPVEIGSIVSFKGTVIYTVEKTLMVEVVSEVINPKTGETLKDLEKESPCIYSPGLHTSEYVPGSLHSLGLKKICDDFDFVSERDASIKFPESAKHQFFRSLQLYINDCNLGKGGKIGEELVLPLNDSKEAHRFMNQYKAYSTKLDSNYLNQVFFTRERYDL